MEDKKEMFDLNAEYSLKLKAKVLDLEAGKMIAVLNSKDALSLGVNPKEKVLIANESKKRHTIATLDISDNFIKKGEIGLFEDVVEELKVKKNSVLKITAVERPKSLEYIKKKLRGIRLSEEEIMAIVNDIKHKRLSDIELACFVSGVYVHDLNSLETVAMTKAMVSSGEPMELNRDVVLDKHSIGGTNGRVTMVVVPIVAAAGYCIPKTSSRAITSAAGTADAMEVLANVSLTNEEMEKIVNKVGGVIAWGGAVNMANVDDAIIQVEHPLSLDPPGQIVASVMSKKISAGANHLVIDIPVGEEVKVKTKERAEILAKRFKYVCKNFGIKSKILLTNGNKPVGQCFGAALEAKEALEVLEGKDKGDLYKKSVLIADEMLKLPGGKPEKASEYIEDGSALEKMKEIIEAQGKKISSSKKIKTAPYVYVYKGKEEGKIVGIGLRNCIKIARLAGAPGDKLAGLKLLVKIGEKIKKNKPLFEIHAQNKRKLRSAVSFAQKNKVIKFERMIIDRI